MVFIQMGRLLPATTVTSVRFERAPEAAVYFRYARGHGVWANV